MGLFDKTETYIESSTSTLYDTDIPGIFEQTILTALVQNRNITEDIHDNMLNSLLLQMGTYYNRAKYNYKYGLPNGTLRTVPESMYYDVELVIESVIGEQISLDYVIYDITNADYFAYDFMQANRGWDYETDIVSNPPFTPNPAGAEVTFKLAEVLGIDLIRITYAYMNGPAEILETEDVPILGITPNENYYYAAYFILNSSGAIGSERFYWTYRASDGTYPILDLEVAIEPESPYYPIVPIREHQVDLTNPDTRDEELYTQSRNLLRTIQIDIDDIGDAVHGRDKDNEDWDQENDPYWVDPDLEEVDHAYIIIGVDVADVSMPVDQYLYVYFDMLRGNSKTNLEAYEYWESKPIGPPPYDTIIVSDANYKMELSYYYIKRTFITGSIGEIGDVEKEFVSNAPTETNSYNINHDALVLRRQESETEYSELLIYGLQHINYVYENDQVHTTLSEAFNESDDEAKNNFVIPIHIDAIQKVGIIIANDVFIHSIRIVFNSKIVEELKWYETGFFKIVILIVAVVVSMYDGGYTLKTVLSMSMAQISILALTQIVKLAFTKVIVAELIDLIGIEAAFVTAIFAARYGIKFDLIAVDDLLLIGPSVVTTFSKSFVLNEVELIQQELEGLQEEQEELDALLMVGLDNPLSVIGYGQNLNYNVTSDTPTAFYDQAIHLSNPGTMSLDGISTFVSTKLTLDMPSTNIRTKVF